MVGLVIQTVKRSTHGRTRKGKVAAPAYLQGEGESSTSDCYKKHVKWRVRKQVNQPMQIRKGKNGTAVVESPFMSYVDISVFRASLSPHFFLKLSILYPISHCELKR